MDNSWKTAIMRGVPSKPVRILIDKDALDILMVNRTRVLDYGCGLGRDANAYGLYKYDPYFYPTRPKGKFDVILCTYVLNVVGPKKRREILKDIRSLLTPKGRAYITVRRDLRCNKVINLRTKTYQYLVWLNEPIIKETSSFCIYVIGKRKGSAI